MTDLPKIIPYVPPLTYRSNGRQIYPFSDLKEVGNAFTYPCDLGFDSRGRSRRLHSIRVAARKWAAYHKSSAKFWAEIVGDVVVCRRDK